jgi:Protein of unknown function (DUF2939)
VLRKLMTAAVLIAATYVGWPIYSALDLKRAIRAGDVATVQDRIHWPTFRQSLHTVMIQEAPEQARQKFARIPIVRKFAEKIAVRFSHDVADAMVENYGNAEGLIYLAGLKASEERQRGAPAAHRSLGHVALELYQRLQWVSFKSLTQLEIEIADRVDPKRRILGAMELKDSGWKLTSFRLYRVGD